MNDIEKIEEHRPWGYYVILADEPAHKVKRIIVKPGKRLSLQRHQKRAEHWYIISGEALVTLDNQQLNLQAGQAVDIPRGAVHRVENPGSNEMAFIEIQTGDYFGEDEIEKGWLIIYYGVKETSAGPLYRLGAAVLDKDDPTKVLGRSNIPILSPREDYERIGDTPNIVFATGALIEKNGSLKIYYGAADSCICMGTANIEQIQNICLNRRKGC